MILQVSWSWVDPSSKYELTKIPIKKATLKMMKVPFFEWVGYVISRSVEAMKISVSTDTTPSRGPMLMDINCLAAWIQLNTGRIFDLGWSPRMAGTQDGFSNVHLCKIKIEWSKCYSSRNERETFKSIAAKMFLFLRYNVVWNAPLVPSRKLTYPTWGSWENYRLKYAKHQADMLILWRVMIVANLIAAYGCFRK